jgi:RNA recognition motif-containing protein
MDKLYIGNLPYSVDTTELRALVEQVAPARSVKIISDRFSGRSLGYGFVEMVNSKDTQQVIDRFSGQPYKGRELAVSYARSAQDTKTTILDHNEESVDRFAQLLSPL